MINSNINSDSSEDVIFQISSQKFMEKIESSEL